MQAGSASSRGFFGGLSIGVVFGLILFTYYRTAWLSDDSYITFRTLDNFVNGYGLRWNISERVQSFTNPLWMFLVAVPYTITREMYLTPLLFSMAVSAAAVALVLFRVAQGWGQALFAGITLLASRAFIDYSSSGLENPLGHLLLGLFLVEYIADKRTVRSYVTLALLAGLAGLNRLDTILFYAPPMFYCLLRDMRWRTFFALGVAGIPLVAWELFSIIYYGFPFPNTAYAKLGSGVPSSEYMMQGLRYFLSSLQRDPSTLPTMMFALLVTVWHRDLRRLAMLIGIALYLLYVVKVGGDFMGGRFFSSALYLSVALVASLPRTKRQWPWLLPAAAAFGASLTAPFAPLFSGTEATRFAEGYPGWRDENRVADERRYYFEHTGLLFYRPGVEMPRSPLGIAAQKYEQEGITFKVHAMIGFRGFFAGPTVHILDRYGLADPLLARLPARHEPNWTTGHFMRTVPLGYAETLEHGGNQIKDPKLAAYYDKLHLIVSGPVFSVERFKTMYEFGRGYYDSLIDDRLYRFPDINRKEMSQLVQPKPTGHRWDAAGVTVMTPSGVEIEIGEIVHFKRASLSLDHNDVYRVVYLLQGRKVGEQDLHLPIVSKGGLYSAEIDVVESAVRRGYEKVHIYPVAGDDKYSLGHFIFPAP